MTGRLTLPQQRSQQTRCLILDAAGRVFEREGYGQASVGDVLVEAGISRGAFYYHFASKEEVFKALLDQHLEERVLEFHALGPVTSLRQVIERFVTLQLEDMKSHRASGSLSFEFMAQAAREGWARTPYTEFHRRAQGVIAVVLRVGQNAGVVRVDLDASAAAWLMLAIFEGLRALKTLDPDGIDLEALKEPWTDLIERFVQSGGQPTPEALREGGGELLEQLRRHGPGGANGQEESDGA